MNSSLRFEKPTSFSLSILYITICICICVYIYRYMSSFAGGEDVVWGSGRCLMLGGGNYMGPYARRNPLVT